MTLCCCGMSWCRKCYPLGVPDLIGGQTREIPGLREAMGGTVNKATNPKDGIGATKVPLFMIPGIALMYQALVHLAGSLKYGKWNWRAAGVRASIYLDAAGRHLNSINEGEWLDPESGLPHCAAVCACMNIMMDAHHRGMLIDDRPPSTNVDMNEFNAHVTRLREMYADKDPKHWTISDPLPSSP